MSIVTLLTIGEWGNLSAKSRHRINVYGLEHERLQTRLQLATDLIAVLTHTGMMPENMMVDGGEAWRAWTEEMKK